MAVGIYPPLVVIVPSKVRELLHVQQVLLLFHLLRELLLKLLLPPQLSTLILLWQSRLRITVNPREKMKIPRSTCKHRFYTS